MPSTGRRRVHEMTICCADIGSVARGNFGWAGLSGEPDREESSGSDIREFAAFVARSLAAEERVSLGFECPLWIPVADEPCRLTRARRGEGSRAWSAAAGSGFSRDGLGRGCLDLGPDSPTVGRHQSLLGLEPLPTFAKRPLHLGSGRNRRSQSRFARVGRHGRRQRVSPRSARSRAEERRDSDVPNSFVDWRRPPLGRLVHGYPVAPYAVSSDPSVIVAFTFGGSRSLSRA